MNLDEIRSEMEAIEAAVQAETDGGEAVTDEQLNRYDELAGLEKRAAKLASVTATAETRSKVVVPKGVGYVTGVAPKSDDTYERAFDHYLRTGQENADLETRAMSEGVGTAGGFTVPTSLANRVIERRVAFGGFENEVELMPTGTGAPIEFPKNDDTANSGEIVNEGGSAVGGADLAFTKTTLGAYTYSTQGPSGGAIKVSYELLRDSIFDLESMLARKMAMRLRRAEAPHWVTGTGVNQPLGLVADSFTQDLDLDTADTVTYGDLVDAQDALDEEYEGNAKWLMRKSTWSLIRKIQDSNGRPIVQMSTDGIAGKPRKMLLGAEVVIDEAMPALSSAGITYPIVYGDLEEAYVIRRVGSISVIRDPYTSKSTRQIEFTAHEAADGIVKERNAYVIVRNNT